jgi:hypothetical protein
MSDKKVVIVQNKHIALGIEKYQGKVDEHLQALVTSAGYEYKTYLFNDGRVLLVLPHEISALLYASKEVLYAKFQLD